MPFDTPCSATFLGTRVLVANQSAVAGDASHQAVLDVEVGEPGLPAYLPTTASFAYVDTPARTTITSGRLAATSCQVSPESAEPQTLPLRPPK